MPVDRPSLDRTVELMQHACAQSNNLILARSHGRPRSHKDLLQSVAVVILLAALP